MKVVLDTGFASSLYKIDKLHLIKLLFGKGQGFLQVWKRNAKRIAGLMDNDSFISPAPLYIGL